MLSQPADDGGGSLAELQLRNLMARGLGLDEVLNKASNIAIRLSSDSWGRSLGLT